jgi:hypothetical protein
MDRRRFVRAVGAASVAGAFGTLDGAPVVAEQQDGATDFAKPANMKAGGQLDSRFPVSFAEPLSQSFRLVTEYFAALGQRNLEALSRTLHFPFAIYEEIEPVVVNSAADFLATPPATLNTTGRGKSRIMPGSYDLLESMNVHVYCPVGTVISLTFNRYTPDGRLLLACDGIYSVTNNDGRWAIQLASTIIREAEFLTASYTDGDQATLRSEQNYLAAFGYGNEAILDDPKTGRGTYDQPLPIGTRVASVNFGYGPRERSRDAREGHPMSGWKVKGVKSRLNVSTVSAETLNRTIRTNLPEFIDLAGGTVGQYSYTRERPVRPITIHATHDKAHTMNGYLRYTTDGNLISETRGVGIRIYKAGHWASGGGLGQVTHHDRSNSKA